MENEYEVTLEDTRAPLDSAHHDVVKRNACCRRMSICVVLSLMAVCGAIAGVVVYINKTTKNSVASDIQDNDDGGSQTRTCNGLASNCHRRVNEIMYATVHNAMSSSQYNLAGSNNIYPLEVSTFSFCFNRCYTVILIIVTAASARCWISWSHVGYMHVPRTWSCSLPCVV
jgi:hypothetical protein